MREKQIEMKVIWDHYQNDISAFFGGFTFTTAFVGGTLVTSILSALVVGFFGGMAGVLAKELAGWAIKKIKGYFK